MNPHLVRHVRVLQVSACTGPDGEEGGRRRSKARDLQKKPKIPNRSSNPQANREGDVWAAAPAISAISAACTLPGARREGTSVHGSKAEVAVADTTATCKNQRMLCISVLQPLQAQQFLAIACKAEVRAGDLDSDASSFVKRMHSVCSECTEEPGEAPEEEEEGKAGALRCGAVRCGASHQHVPRRPVPSRNGSGATCRDLGQISQRSQRLERGHVQKPRKLEASLGHGEPGRVLRMFFLSNSKPPILGTQGTSPAENCEVVQI